MLKINKLLIFELFSAPFRQVNYLNKLLDKTSANQASKARLSYYRQPAKLKKQPFLTLKEPAAFLATYSKFGACCQA
jgi:hypothetical protein